MRIVPRARAEKISIQAQRVFLYCAAANVSDRDALIDDLLSHDAGVDCVVLYVDPPDAPRDEHLLENELRGTQGLVLWVTKELLETMRAGNMPAEYRLARELHLPVLPVAKFDALLPEFTRLEGAIHAIAKSDSEYHAKLSAQLEKLFISKEEMEATREKAFIAKLFLSYRKMDIEEARRFMRKLHDMEGFEAISIWYDNFLTAGENFDNEIEKFIKESDAFTLVVTPNLATPDNYVREKEYPVALAKHKKPIIPVETVSTDFETFARLFPGVDKTVPLENPTALRSAFCAKLGDAITPAPLDNERAFHLGRAYLIGFGVERDFNRAIRLLETAAGDFSESALHAAEILADIYQNGMGMTIDYGKALRWNKKAVVISEHVFGVEHPGTAISYNNIGSIYQAQGEYPQALEWLQKAMAIHEKALGVEHSDTAISYANIGNIYLRQGNYSQALVWLTKALAISEKMLGKEHPNTARSCNDIGAIYQEQGDSPQALKWFQKSLAISEKTLGKEHPETATTYSNIGAVYHQQDDYSQALEWYMKALAVQEKVLGKEHPNTAMFYNNIGTSFFAKGDHPQALEWYEKALAVHEKILGMEHPDTAKSYNNIGTVFTAQGDYSQAMEWAKKALTIREKMWGKEHPDTADSYRGVGNIYCAQGDSPQALKWYVKALAIQEKMLGKEHPSTANLYGIIGAIYYVQGDYPQSLEWTLMAYIGFCHSLGSTHPSTTNTCNHLQQGFIANGGNKRDFEQWLKESMGKGTVAPQPKTKGFWERLFS